MGFSTQLQVDVVDASVQNSRQAAAELLAAPEPLSGDPGC